MKLNNKGFAITALLYSVMILFLVLMASSLQLIRTRDEKLTNISDRLEKKLVGDYEDINKTLDGDTNTTSFYQTQYRGKYTLTINYSNSNSNNDSVTTYIYLPKFYTIAVNKGNPVKTHLVIYDNVMQENVSDYFKLNINNYWHTLSEITDLYYGYEITNVTINGVYKQK